MTCPDSMADVVESLEVGWVRGPPKAVGAFRFFLNLGRVDGFGLDGNGRRAKREPEHVSFVQTVRTILYDYDVCTTTWNDN